jgi:hypothetical protein
MNKSKLKKLFPLLKILRSLSEEDRNVVLPFLTHEGCEGLYDCVYNGLWNETLTDRGDIQKRLGKNKHKFRRLLDERVSSEKKKKTLQQVGGDIGWLLEKVLPALAFHLSRKK